MGKVEPTDKELEAVKGILEDFDEFVDKNTDHPKKRVDILFNTICGGGIFLIFSIFKDDIAKTFIQSEFRMLVYCGVGFMAAILLNYFAMGLFVNVLESTTAEAKKMVQNYLESSDDNAQNNDFYEKKIKYTAKFGMYIHKTLKIISVLLMTGSIITLMIFFFQYFNRQNLI